MSRSGPAAAARGGFLLVLEGIDGAGTTTQGRRLARRLRRRGGRALFTSEPSGGVVGRHIRRCLAESPGPSPDRLALLFAADRLDHFETVIAPALGDDTVVICDRYVLSSLAYQGAEGDAAWVRSLNGRAPGADLTILLDVAPAVAARRRGQRGGEPDRYERTRFQQAVAAQYRKLARGRNLGQIAVLPGGGTPREIATTIDGLLLPRLWERGLLIESA